MVWCGVGMNGFVCVMCVMFVSVVVILSEVDVFGGDVGDDCGVVDVCDGVSMYMVFSMECNGYFDW